MSEARANGAAVELRGITNRFKGIAALKDVNLSIREGEFFSLLGPSGCGKTTTLNIIGGFVHPDEGDVLIQGQSVLRMPPYRRPVNTVFQSYALFPHMSIADNVGFGPRMAGCTPAEVAKRVKDALALVSLSHMGDRRPSQLSGGQQQRVALARALVNKPSVLLLDEPLGALDMKLRKQMQLELTRIQREVGVTFVYVTHDQEEAMTMSDRIAVMNKASVVQIGTPQEVYEHPVSLFVADFIGSSNILYGALVERSEATSLVRLAEGVLVRVASPASNGNGDKVAVVIRPDHMSFSANPAAADGENSLVGRVNKLSYLGTHLQFAVEIAPGTEVTISQPLSSPAKNAVFPSVGEGVYVTWAAEQSLCFPDERN
jgi:spermidine/putrescine transport system ATP-binding protein